MREQFQEVEMWHRLHTDRDEMADVRLGTLFEASGPQPEGPQTTPLMGGRDQTHLGCCCYLNWFHNPFFKDGGVHTVLSVYFLIFCPGL